jgi:hypothetical protein
MKNRHLRVKEEEKKNKQTNKDIPWFITPWMHPGQASRVSKALGSESQIT